MDTLHHEFADDGASHHPYKQTLFYTHHSYMDEANLLLWHCQTQQEGHFTGLRLQENDTLMGRPSSTD